MGFTLADLAKIEKQALRKGVIENLLRDSDILGMLPFENVDALTNVVVRWRNLPATGFRAINAAYTHAEGSYEQVYESVYLLGGEIQLDRIFGKVKNTVVDPRVDQISQKVKSLALTFNDYFINGDTATDPDGFEGLKKRVAGMPTRQSVYVAASNAAAADPTSSAAAARTFVTKLEEAYYKTNRGKVNAIFCNEGMRWGIGRAIRLGAASGGAWLELTKDAWDREILTYKGAPLVDAGLKKDQSTEIITDTETAGDAASDATSLYFVSFGLDDGLVGIQLNELETYDPNGGGEMETTPAKQIRIEWPVGLANFGSYSIVRVRNVEGVGGWTE